MSAKKAKPEKLTAAKLLEIFEQEGALLSGHFRLSSGRHSEKYLQCAIVLQHPEIARLIGSALAEKFSKTKPDCVVGPAIGGIVVAQEVARALGVRGMFTERESGTMTFRRGFAVQKGERVLVVEDIITTGGSVREVIDAVSRAGGDVVGVGVIIDRSGGKTKFEVPFKPLARLRVTTFREEACPLCRRGVPVYKPGSRKS